MKIVLDANVIISALGTRGLCAEVFEYGLHQHEIIISRSILEEVLRSLKHAFGFPPKKLREHRKFFLSAIKIVETGDLPASVCRDPDDAHVLSAAWAEKVDVIVTGDKDLLTLSEFRGIPILSVRDFWERKPSRDPAD